MNTMEVRLCHLYKYHQLLSQVGQDAILQTDEYRRIQKCHPVIVYTTGRLTDTV